MEELTISLGPLDNLQDGWETYKRKYFAVRSAFPLWVSTASGKKFLVTSLRPDDTVAELKQQVHLRTNEPVAQLVLRAAGAELQDEHTLGASGIKPDGQIFAKVCVQLVLCPTGLLRPGQQNQQLRVERSDRVRDVMDRAEKRWPIRDRLGKRLEALFDVKGGRPLAPESEVGECGLQPTQFGLVELEARFAANVKAELRPFIDLEAEEDNAEGDGADDTGSSLMLPPPASSSSPAPPLTPTSAMVTLTAAPTPVMIPLGESPAKDSADGGGSAKRRQVAKRTGPPPNGTAKNRKN